MDPDGIYVDGTFGRGGHARAILARLGAAGRLIALDRDPEAVAAARALAATGSAPDRRPGPLRRPGGGRRAASGSPGGVQGILLDLGVSSPQLDTAERGFSFVRRRPARHAHGPAARASRPPQWLARADEAEIAAVLHDLGEERFAERIARAIVAARAEAPILTTRALADLVARAVPDPRAGQAPGHPHLSGPAHPGQRRTE